MARKAQLTVVFSAKARWDLQEIWLWNANHYNADHAGRYAAFLFDRVEWLAAHPSEGVPVEERPGVFRLTIKRRPQGHGHIVFYRATERELEIVRVLHTARDWPTIVGE